MRKLIVALLLTMPVMAMAKPTYYAQTNHFALKQGQDWSWEQVIKTPNIKWEYKTPKQQKGDTTIYYDVYGDFGKYGVLNVFGSRNRPSAIYFRSSQSYRESENGKDVYTLYQLFNKTELTKIKSNCSVDIGGDVLPPGDYQHFYKWQKQGYQSLYLGVRRDSLGGGVNMEYIIVTDFNEFNREYVYGLWRYDVDGSEIACRILN